MGEIEKRQICQEMGFKDTDKTTSQRVHRVLMETKYDIWEHGLIVESDLDDSLDSSSSSSSPSSSPSPSSSCSPLFELSELMAQLPIKRGLSKFYQGKSESFASLTSVESIEDLAKKAKYSCRSRKSMKRLSPKANIAKNKKGPSSIFSSLGKMSSLMAS